MKVEKCKNGHYYDADHYASCPYCDSADSQLVMPGVIFDPNSFSNRDPASGVDFFPEPQNVPKRKVCANCHSDYIEGDAYCRYCGAPMGTPDFIPENFGCIYGPPPVVRKHRCEKCGYAWETNRMIDHERWCPKCGGAAPASEEKGTPFFGFQNDK